MTPKMKPEFGRNLLRSTLAIGLLVTMLIQPQLSFACGPFSLSSVFVFTVHPEYPLENFARGEIGVAQPSYARSYLVVAYRYLSGASFNSTEQQALVELWRDRLDLRWTPEAENSVQTWLDVRQRVPVWASTPPKIDVYRSREKPNQFESYLNCQQGAFENAATTLEAKIKKVGAENQGVKDWVEAQDQVFANCSEGQHIPDVLPADANALLRADRQYQIAAANFYAGNFDAALTLFESIAADANSPWRATAPYLAARALLRKASLGPEETKKEALVESEKRLNQIIGNTELKSSHADAERLLSLVRLRLHPEERLHELGISLAKKAQLPDLKQELWDYTVLLDQTIGDEDAHHQQLKTARSTNAGRPSAYRAHSSPDDVSNDDLTDWIVTFQSDKAEALEHALARWQATSSVPWLIAALSKVDSQHPKAAALRQAAGNISPASPAFASASFHNIRLDLGRPAEARTKLDDLLNKHRSRFTRSSLNLLERQRMFVAQNLDDFLAHAQRIPAGLTWDEDGRQIPVNDAEVSDELKQLQGKTQFDSDAGEILNRKVPLAVLSQIPGSDALPHHLRRDVTQAVWLRAVLLGDAATATALTPRLKAAVPELTPLLDTYATTRDPAAKKFAAIYAWLKFPGLEPVVDTGLGRQIPLDEQDSYRNNWWCTAAFPTPETSSEKSPSGMSGEDRIPVFLTAVQRATAEKQYATLATFGAAPNYLAREVVAWATKNPGDPRVPEALHLAVKTTRYGCTDKQTGRWSKAAYDFLHRRYPNSAWAKQTPYWFKD